MMLNEDYRDILQIFSDESVRFLLVGAYAMAAHGYLRATIDIDIWIMQSPQNAETVNIEGIEVHIPSLEDIICNKKALGRTKDLADLEVLERLKER